MEHRGSFYLSYRVKVLRGALSCLQLALLAASLVRGYSGRSPSDCCGRHWPFWCWGNWRCGTGSALRLILEGGVNEQEVAVLACAFSPAEEQLFQQMRQVMDPGHLVIRLQRTQKRLLISVSDDGIGMEEEVLEQLNSRLGKGGVVGSQLKEESQGGVALVNVDNRIRLLFGAEYGLHVYSMVGVGTTVEIALPCIVNDWDVKNLEALQ